MEFLIRVVSKGNGMLIGGVVAVRENGADWTHEELTHLDWRIVRCDGLTQAEINSLLSTIRINGVLHKRQMYFDSDAVVAAKWPRDTIPTVLPSQARNYFRMVT